MSKLIEAVTNDMTKLIPMLFDAGKCPGDYCNDMPIIETSDLECDCNGEFAQCEACWKEWMEV